MVSMNAVCMPRIARQCLHHRAPYGRNLRCSSGYPVPTTTIPTCIDARLFTTFSATRASRHTQTGEVHYVYSACRRICHGGERGHF